MRQFSLFLFFIFPCFVFAQPGKPKRIPVPKPVSEIKISPQISIAIGLGAHVPLGELADRFGNNNRVSGGFHYFTNKHWSFGAEGIMLFGKQVREDVLAPLRNDEGNLFGTDQQLASVVLRERGYYIGPQVGYQRGSNGRKGINSFRSTFGLGYMNHKLRIQDDFSNFPQTQGINVRGYDRLSAGPALQAAVGYLYQSYSGGINVYLALETIYGRTKELRTFRYDTGQFSPTSTRNDLLLGFKAIWFLPIKNFDAPESLEY